MLSDFRAGKHPVSTKPIDIERFDRRAQAGQFADVFRMALAATHAK